MTFLGFGSGAGALAVAGKTTQKTTHVFDAADTSFPLAVNISEKRQGMQSIPGTSAALAGGFEDKLLSCRKIEGKKRLYDFTEGALSSKLRQKLA